MTQTSLDKLSKKNKEFIHIATHQFMKDGKTDSEIHEILEKIIPEILENQPKGITARGLYGAPSAWATSFTTKERYEAEHPKENDDPKLMIMDSILFIFGFFSLLSSIVNIASSKPSVYGLVTLILGSCVGGGALYSLHHFIYRFYGPEYERSQRPPIWKSVIIMILAMLLWLVAITVTSLLPEIINPHLPNLVIVILGALVLALRFYLKKRLNIKTTAMGPTR
ncbi:MAG: DUF1129 family protein [Streptococcus sp.]|nr:DUF1129 family protein [Streptococcus sp.]